jgi:asparagine synthetase B (glutamine-hydrolysing)
MCGIIGIIGDGINLAEVEKAMGCQVSRGPDSFGLFQEPGMLFGHRRLAIMDTSVHSA